jgi:hypothetical protein
VIDRIEGDQAVLLVGAQERELVVPLRDLPAGCRPGLWVRVTLDGEYLRHVEPDHGKTRERQARIQEKMDRLLGKGPKGQ